MIELTYNFSILAGDIPIVSLYIYYMIHLDMLVTIPHILTRTLRLGLRANLIILLQCPKSTAMLGFGECNSTRRRKKKLT